jgi:hypothetical protein
MPMVKAMHEKMIQYNKGLRLTPSAFEARIILPFSPPPQIPYFAAFLLHNTCTT